MVRIFLFLFTTYFTFHSTCWAGVNLKNGNFYISYTDVYFNEQFEFNRTYNSRSTFNGMFGYGWGNDYDEYLTVNGDGSITVEENGGGKSTHYQPTTEIPFNINSMIEQMISAYQAIGILQTNKDIEQFNAALIRDRELRNVRWKYVVSAGLVNPPKLPLGTKLVNEESPNNSILVTPFGFLRINGSVSKRFNLAGKISRISTSDSSYINIERNTAGNIRKVENELGQYVIFKTNNQGRVLQMISNTGSEAHFRYEGENLIEAFDAGANRYKYQYDANHNMTAIVYGDQSTMTMAYNDKSFVVAVTKRSGDVTDYEYVEDDLVSVEERTLPYGVVIERYGTYVTKTGFNGRQVKNSYFYNIASDEQGRAWTSRIETVVNDLSTTTDYHPCGSPTKIQRGRRVTVFDYDDACKLTYKNNGSRIKKISYEPKFGKIRHVVDADVDGNIISESKFAYDNKGNLTDASNHKGNSVKLIYNDDGEIIKMTDGNGKVLLFSYNRIGKPEKIILQGVGSIEVTYSDSGEIIRVDSPEGHTMALQVTQMFQNLLALVKPAGVNFNM